MSHSGSASSFSDAPLASSSISRNSLAVNLQGMKQLLWHIPQRYLARSDTALADSFQLCSGDIGKASASWGFSLTEPEVRALRSGWSKTLLR